MAAVTSPITHAQQDGGAIQSRYAFLLGAIRSRLAEMVSLRTLGAIPFAEDLAGSGSDTLREIFYDSIGWAATMASLGETASITLSDIAVEIEDTAIGRFGIGYSESYMSQILGRDGELNIELLARLIPNAWEANWMNLLATTLAGAAADYGTSGVAMSFDDYLDAIFYFRTLDGFEFRGMDGTPNLFSLLHGKQFTDLANSVRAEPNYQMPEPTDAQLAGKGPGFQFDWLGARNYQSNRISAGGGNRNGAFFAAGAIGYVIGGTRRVRVKNPATAILLPEIGLVTEFDGTPGAATSSMYSNAWLGQSIRDDDQVRGMVTKQ